MGEEIEIEDVQHENIERSFDHILNDRWTGVISNISLAREKNLDFVTFRQDYSIVWTAVTRLNEPLNDTIGFGDSYYEVIFLSNILIEMQQIARDVYAQEITIIPGFRRGQENNKQQKKKRKIKEM